MMFRLLLCTANRAFNPAKYRVDRMEADPSSRYIRSGSSPSETASLACTVRGASWPSVSSAKDTLRNWRGRGDVSGWDAPVVIARGTLRPRITTLVERHGGIITATSQGRGLGSTFTVLLPLAAHREAPPTGVDVSTLARVEIAHA